MPLFTAETAAINGRKGAINRWIAEKNPQPPPEQPPIAEVVTEGQAYVRVRLDRVRKQLDMLLDALDGAIAGTTMQLDRKGNVVVIDPQGIDRISSSIWRVSEMERKYAGRPDPGSFRPMPERSRSKGRAVEVWSDAPPTPQPVVNSMPQPVVTQPTSTPDDVSH